MTKATVDRADLKRALGILAPVSDSRSTKALPVLQHVRLSVNGSVQLEATDLETSAVFQIARQGRGGEFRALLPAKRLAEYVRKSKADTVTFENQSKETTSLDGVASLVGLSLDDFPTTMGAEGDLRATFAAGELATALRVSQFSVSTEVVRYALTGVLLEVKQTGTGKGPKSFQAVLVASDGKRLASARLPVEKPTAIRVIIPWKAAELLERLVSGVDPLDRVEIRTTNVQATDAATGTKSETADVQQIHFRVGGDGLYTRAVEGHFPDHEAVVPSNLSQSASFDRKTLIAELERVRQACTDKTLATKFTFTPGKLALYSKTQDVGEARAELPGDGDADLSIVFNPDYVIDYLKALGKSVERVTIRVKDRHSAALFEGFKGSSYLLMPLTINI
jgi:DNA polymerase-3 subunit beta